MVTVYEDLHMLSSIICCFFLPHAVCVTISYSATTPKASLAVLRHKHHKVRYPWKTEIQKMSLDVTLGDAFVCGVTSNWEDPILAIDPLSISTCLTSVSGFASEVRLSFVLCNVVVVFLCSLLRCWWLVVVLCFLLFLFWVPTWSALELYHRFAQELGIAEATWSRLWRIGNLFNLRFMNSWPGNQSYDFKVSAAFFDGKYPWFRCLDCRS